jgi:predicted Mrr-cat superfamily restriction endonuclease
VRAWVVRAADVATFTAFEREGIVGIRGGPPEGAVTVDLRGQDEDGIARLVADAGLPAVQATVLSAFVVSAEVGDAVVTPEPGGKPGRDILLGRITGGYEHHEPPRATDLRHVRRVDWEERLPRVMLPTEFWQGRSRAVTEAPLDDLRELLGL